MSFDIYSISEIGLNKLIDKDTLKELFASLGNIVRIEISILDLSKKKYSEVRLTGHNICRANEDAVRDICERTKKGVLENLPSVGMKRIDCEVGFSYLLSPLDYETEVVGYVILGPYISPENRTKAEEFIRKFHKDEGDIENCVNWYRHLSNVEAAQLMKDIKQLLTAFLYSSYKMYLTSKMHLESERENYAEIEILNNRLNEMLNEVESVSKYKTAFIKTITHELRTPLTSIIGFSEMLMKECYLNPELKSYASTINQKGIELLKIINDILVLSSIESGTIVVKKERRNIVEDVRDIINSFYHEFEKKALRISYTPFVDNSFYEYDEEKFKAIVSRIIDNSIKFTSDGGSVAVFVSEKFISPEMSGDRFGTTPKRFVSVTIEDTGCGIDEDKIHMVFEPFYQAVSNMDTREKGGMGLGLKIAKGFAEAMGGELKIESRVGMGTKVTLLLPA
ncbi:MAG: HAMP domain-containing histidine kinase [Deltaproteobacteria bacterium]|nr:HAMP domain-containing histidine kinase [Deltaproteobacteria bacterium]